MKRRDHLKPGYKAMNGYIFTDEDCIRYNRIQDRINSFLDGNMPVPEIELTYSHKTFCWITGLLS